MNEFGETFDYKTKETDLEIWKGRRKEAKNKWKFGMET